MGITSVSNGTGEIYLPNQELSEEKIFAREQLAYVTMVSRESLREQVDEFLCSKTKEEQYFYFSSLIKEKKRSLPENPTERDFDNFARQLFDNYRQKMVEEICAKIDAHPGAWLFKSDQWQEEKSLFKDFLWGYIKMCFVPSVVVGQVMQENLEDKNKEMEKAAHLRNTGSTRYHPQLHTCFDSEEVLYPFNS